MKNYIYLFHLNILYLLLLSMALHAEVVDKIVVVVNNEVITQGEIDRIIAPAYEQYKMRFSEDQMIRKLDETRQAVIGQLIEEKLILGEAKKQNIEVDEKDISARVQEAKKRFPSEDLFEQALAAQHMSLKDLKAKFKEQLMVKKLMDQKVSSRIYITPSDIVDYYNMHIEEFSQPEMIKLSNIMIKPKQSVKVEKTAELVSEIERRLRSGGDFAELARIYSEGPGAKEGGVMGYVKRGDLLPEIEEAVFNMGEGETSGVITTKLGYHFFKVEEKTEPRTIDLSDARRSIEETIWMTRMREKSKEWVKELKKNAYIAFK